MRTLKNLFFLLLLAAPLAAVAAPSPVVGAWNYTFDAGGTVYSGIITVTEQDGVYQGTITVADSPASPLDSVKVEGNTLYFEFVAGEYGQMKITATIDGDNFAGDWNAVNFGSFPVSGTRKVETSQAPGANR